MGNRDFYRRLSVILLFSAVVGTICFLDSPSVTKMVTMWGLMFSAALAGIISEFGDDNNEEQD